MIPADDAAHNAPYEPIACGFHDRLEHWAIRREPVEVVWRALETERSATSRIVDVWAQGGADYLKLETGERIRLDRLVSVGGVPLPDRC